MTLEQELKAEKVTHLNLDDFCQVASGVSVRETIKQMQNHKVNVCLITEGNNLKGIFTDRDVLRKVAPSPAVLDQMIEAVMTANPVTISPDSSAAAALWTMDERGFRNLPVVDSDGRIVGNMTHQAVISYLAARYPIEVLNRPPRPDQFPRKQEGGD